MEKYVVNGYTVNCLELADLDYPMVLGINMRGSNNYICNALDHIRFKASSYGNALQHLHSRHNCSKDSKQHCYELSNILEAMVVDAWAIGYKMKTHNYEVNSIQNLYLKAINNTKSLISLLEEEPDLYADFANNYRLSNSYNTGMAIITPIMYYAAFQSKSLCAGSLALVTTIILAACVPLVYEVEGNRNDPLITVENIYDNYLHDLTILGDIETHLIRMNHS